MERERAAPVRLHLHTHTAVLQCDISSVNMISVLCCVYVGRWALCFLSGSTERFSWQEKDWRSLTSFGTSSAAQTHISETHTCRLNAGDNYDYKRVIHPKLNPIIIYATHMLRFIFPVETKRKIKLSSSSHERWTLSDILGFLVPGGHYKLLL